MPPDPLAVQQNVAGDSTVAPVPVAAAPLPAPTWAQRLGNYIKNTNMADLDEALKRANPLTGGFYDLKDMLEGHPENVALKYGQASRFPTDIASGLVGMYPAIATIRSQIEANKTGQAPAPISPFAQSLDETSKAIDRIGRSWAEEIAGRSLDGDDAGSLLRGTPPEMAGNWGRVLTQAMLPMPSKVTAPIIAAGNAIKEGLGVLGPAAQIAAKAIEGLTPLAVSSAPSAVSAATNLTLQGGLGVLGEAAVNALFPAKEAAAKIEKSDQLANAGTTQATETINALPPKPVQASVLPSTGNDAADIAAGFAMGGAALWGWKNRRTALRAVDGLARPTLGYSYIKPEDASIQSLTTKLRQQYGSGDASLGDSLAKTMRASGVTEKAIQDTVLRADEAAATRSGAAVSTRERGYYRTGEFMDTPIKSVSPNDVFELHNQLSDTQKDLLKQGMWSEQELTTRERLVKKDLGSGAPNVGSPPARATLLSMEANAARSPSTAGTFQNRYAHNLYETPSRDLEALRTAAYADPDVAQVMRGYRDIINKTVDYTAMEKRVTAPEAAKFRNDNPHYIPPNIPLGDKFFNSRDPVATYNPRSGVGVPRGARTFDELPHPIAILPRYLDEAFRSTEGMKTKRDYIQAVKAYKSQGNPYAAQLIGRDLSGPPGPDAANRFVSWRDHTGQKVYTEVHDAVVRDALNGATNPTTLQLHNGFLSNMTRAYEGAAVGVNAVLGGTIFAPFSALYSTTLGTIGHRPPGVRMGWADKLSGALGGPTIKGDWLTHTVDAFGVRAPINAFQLSVDRLGQHLHNQVLTDGYLTKAIDPASLQKAADAMHAWYRKTNLAAMQSRGMMAPGGAMSIDTAKIYTHPEDALKRMGIVGSTGHFLADMLHAMTAAPQSSLMAMNKGVDPVVLSSAMRNLTGDPGRSGAFKHAGAAAWALNRTPWGNVSLQGIGKVAGTLHSTQGFTKGGVKEVAGKAASFGMGLFNGIMLPAAGITLWNAALGPEYSKYQFLDQPVDRNTEIYIGWPGKPPEAGIHIAIDPLLRHAKVAADALAGLYSGAFSGEFFKPENADVARAYKEMMHNRYMSMGDGSVLKALFQQAIVPPMNPLAAGYAATQGVQLRHYGDTRVLPEHSDQGFAPGMRPGSDNFLDRLMPATAEDTLRALGAGLGGLVYNLVHGMSRDLDPNAARFGNQTKTVGEALGTQWKDWKQNVADSTRYMSGPLFDTYRARVPSQEASAMLVNQKMKSIDAIAEQFKDTTSGGAPRILLGNKKIGLEERLGANPAQPDLNSGGLASDIVQLKKDIEPTMSQIKAKFQNFQSLQDSNKYEPDMKRALRNNESKEITELYRRLLMDLQRAESVLSTQYGTEINFNNLKLQGGPLK